MGKEHIKEMNDEQWTVTIEHKDEIIVDMLVIVPCMMGVLRSQFSECEERLNINGMGLLSVIVQEMISLRLHKTHSPTRK